MRCINGIALSCAQALILAHPKHEFLGQPPVTCRQSTGREGMPRGVLKENLPSKVCAVCERPFTWRKVWEKCWDEVRESRREVSADGSEVQTCSDRCKNERRRRMRQERRAHEPEHEVSDGGNSLAEA